jgi:hypothetical protein
MPTRDNKPSQKTANTAFTPAVNRFAPPQSFVQPKTQEQYQPTPEEIEKIKASGSNWPDVSMFTTNRPAPAPKPRVQMKFKKSSIDPLIQLKGSKPEQRTERIKGATLWARDKKGKILPPSLDDIGQGKVKNCFLFAAMAAIVNKDPQLIVNMIKDNGNGTYTVTFKGIGFGFLRAKQTVTADFLAGKHGRVRERNAFWPLIIEKAYAQQLGGTNEIYKGAHAGTTVKDLTNKKTSNFNPKEKSVDYVMNMLIRAKMNRQMVTLISPDIKVASQDAVAIANSGSGLRWGHAYTMIDVDPSNERIKLFNPWGYNHPNGDGWIGITAVQKFFIDVSING